MSPVWLNRFLGALERGVSLQDVGRSAQFTTLVEKVARVVARTGATPNALTVLSLVPALLAAVFAARGAFGWAVAFMLLSGLLDLLDGPLARATGRSSRFGALLDSSLDRISDALPLLGLTVLFARDGWGWAAVIPSVALLAGYTVSYVRARCEGLAITLPPLWMRRGDRIVLVALSMLAGMIAPVLVLVGTALAAILGLLAATDALRVAYRESGATVPPAPEHGRSTSSGPGAV
jgi:CDP-diacylglycerol--glycerol-3-phosphate 3-phosphatidyltransferase